ncbi:hypothetical protein QTI66_03800 [Variovorax sp. J22R133]|nr:hypothetical protein [Variovorax sp. J22R133]MDM0111256.1 hypothetical protein [Variovorax sp. J22R133]
MNTPSQPDIEFKIAVGFQIFMWWVATHPDAHAAVRESQPVP